MKIFEKLPEIVVSILILAVLVVLYGLLQPKKIKAEVHLEPGRAYSKEEIPINTHIKPVKKLVEPGSNEMIITTR